MVQVLPNYSAQIGQDLGNIVASVQRMWQPDWDLQQKMKGVLATNPQLLQTLANLESQNPGTLGRLGLGPIANTVGGVQPDIGTVMQQMLRPDIVDAVNTNRSRIATQAATGQFPEQIAAGQLAGQQAQLGSQQIANDPNVARQAGLQAATGMPSGEMAKNTYNEKTFTKGLEMLQNGPEVLLSKVVNGEYSNDELNAIMATPLGEALKFQLDDLQERNRLRIAQTQHAQGRGDALARFREGKAFEFMMASGIPDFSTAYQYLYGKDEKTGQPISRLAEEWASADPTTLTPEQLRLVQGYRGLVDVREGRDAITAGRRNAIVSSATRDAMTALNNYEDTFKNDDLKGDKGDGMREAAAIALQDAFNRLGAATGKKYEVDYDVNKKWYGTKRNLVVKDAVGNVTDIGTALRELSTNDAETTSQNPQAPTQATSPQQTTQTNKQPQTTPTTQSAKPQGENVKGDDVVERAAVQAVNAIKKAPPNAKVSELVKLRNKANNAQKKAAYNRILDLMKGDLDDTTLNSLRLK